MSSYFKEFASDSEQPKEFSFTAENLREAKVVLKRYPKDYPEGAFNAVANYCTKTISRLVTQKGYRIYCFRS